MNREVTLTHLARRLHVHPTTVSMALLDRGRISEPMRRRIKALAARWQYRPNHIARSLRHRSTKTLGVLFPYATLPYYATLLDALSAEADARGLHMEVHFHQWSAKLEADALRALVERRVDGLIFLGAASSSFQTLAQSLPPSMGIPVAVLGIVDPRDLPRCVRGSVTTDVYAGSRRLGEHLQEMGHRQLAILVPERPQGSQSPYVSLRVRGLRDGFQARQKSRRIEVVSLDEEERAGGGRPEVERRGSPPQNAFLIGRQLAERFLKLSPRPTAVVTSNESTAHVLLSALSEHGLRVPDDVSVACYDGTFLSAFGTVPLTTVAQPFELMARRLIELITTKPESPARRSARVEMLPPTLITRASVARVKSNGPSPSSTMDDSGVGSISGQENQT